MKRKIAFISHESPLATLGGIDAGGQVVYVGKLAKKLSQLGYEVDIFTRLDDARLPKIVEWDKNVRVIHIKAGPITFIPKEELLSLMDEFIQNMWKFIKGENLSYNLIHANFWLAGYVALNLKKLLNIPFVITFHALGKIRRIFQGSKDKFPDNRFSIEEQIIKDASKVIAECPQDQEDLINYYTADKSKISVIPAGVDPAEFFYIDKLLAKMVLNIDEKKPIILQLGRMVERKGLEDVIKAVAILRRKYKLYCRLLIVGGESDSPSPRFTPEIGRLKEIAKKEKVSDLVIFTGRKSRENLKYYYSASDVFVTTPWYEPFGMTPIEAMACGTPVIGSKVGGIKYTVVDGKTGYLVPAKKPEKLAQKLFDLLRNKKIASLFKENGIKRVNELFTWDKIASSISKLYESVLYQGKHISDKEKQLFIIEKNFKELSKAVIRCQIALRVPILDSSQAIYNCFLQGGKVLICGNGGSSSESSHFATELMGKFMIPFREGLPVISLTSDSDFLTAWSNDFSFDEVFSRQVSSLGNPNDILIGISSSGNSQNLNLAFLEAHKLGMTTIGLLGKDGGVSANICDISLIVPSDDTQRIQEIHLNAIHIICEILENKIFAEQEQTIPYIKSRKANQLFISQDLKKKN